MTQKVNTVSGIIGSGMAAGPAFYESTAWLSTVAILGMIVLILASVNSVITLKRNLKRSNQEQSDKKN